MFEFVRSSLCFQSINWLPKPIYSPRVRRHCAFLWVFGDRICCHAMIPIVLRQYSIFHNLDFLFFQSFGKWLYSSLTILCSIPNHVCPKLPIPEAWWWWPSMTLTWDPHLVQILLSSFLQVSSLILYCRDYWHLRFHWSVLSCVCLECRTTPQFWPSPVHVTWLV